MTEPETEALIEKTVKQTLLQLGLNVSDPESVLELQKDFAYVRAWRRGVQSVGFKAFTLGFIGLVTFMLSALWTGIKSSILRGNSG